MLPRALALQAGRKQPSSQSPTAGWSLSWRYLSATTSVCNPQTPSTLAYDNGQMIDHTSDTGSSGYSPSCTKTIQAPANKRIKIVFERLARPSQSQSLNLYDGDSDSGTSANRLSTINYNSGVGVHVDWYGGPVRFELR